MQARYKQKQIPVMDYEHMKNLISEDSDTILQTLNDSRKGFAEFLQQKGSYTEREVTLAIELVAKACDSPNLGRVRRLLNLIYDYGNTFLSADIFKIIQDVIEKDYQMDLSRFVYNYVIVLQHLTIKAELELPTEVLLLLENSVNEMENINLNVQLIKKELKTLLIQKEQKDQSVQEPPENFRKLPILPVAKDMKVNETNPPFLRPNIIEGPYKDVEHYLDVQFRLMREDMLRSFRASISAVVTGKKSENKSSSTQQSVLDSLYTKLKLADRPTYRIDGIYYTITFECAPNMTQKNNGLIPGSIVCLSCDNFRDVLVFATIRSQKVEGRKCTISVIEESHESELSLQQDYQMIITTAFFESHRHILSALKNFNVSNFPLMNYIVSLDPSDSQPEYKNDMFCLHENCKSGCNVQCANGTSRPCKEFNVLCKKEWPSPEDLKLDKDQVTAFQAALTQKLAIIQGPPGTGKTFLGIKIVKALLENAGKKPLVICCLTNHALDQFLKHVMERVTEKVVRVGYQSQDTDIQTHALGRLAEAVELGRLIKNGKSNDTGEIDQCLEIALNLVPDILNFKDTKDYDEEFIKLIQLCENLNDHFSCYLELMFEYLESSVLKAYVPTTMKGIFERDPDHKAKTLKQFVVTWLGIEKCPDFYKSCESRWKKLNDPKELQSARVDENADIWTVSSKQRFFLLYKWRMNKIGELSEYIRKNRERYLEILSKRKAENTPETRSNKFVMDQVYLAQASDVIGVTMTGAAKNKGLFQMLQPQIMIVEEAAQSLEADIIAALVPSIEQLILIGDHEQLRPIPSDDDLSKEYNLQISLFERLFKNKIPCATLTTQHRMKPCISELLKPHIYPKLRNHESVTKFEKIVGMQHDVFFVNHEVYEDEKKSNSVSNTFEAKFIVKLASHFVNIGYKTKNITILAMYAAQLTLIQQLLKSDDDISDILVTTVDNYQGEENDIVLISLVRSNPWETIGFLKESNRLCVALSRARKGLYCIGNFNMLARKSKFWLNVVEKVKSRGEIGEALPIQCSNHNEVMLIKSDTDFDDIGAKGCDRICGFKLPCNHVCEKTCHFEDSEHTSYRCMKPCNKVIYIKRQEKIKQRRCKRRCGEPCEESKSSVRLPCGHLKVGNWNDDSIAEITKCIFEDKKILPCGHEDSVPCSVSVTEHKCRALVGVKLHCGHVKKVPCSQKELGNLQTVCKGSKLCTSVCGHTVTLPCYVVPTEDVLVSYCKKSCDMLLKCGHPCVNPCNWCYDMKIHSNCSYPCEQKLYCGHQCRGYCGAPCFPCESRCQLGCCHSTCINPCGKPCVECKEPCPHQCRHQKCKKLCYEECDISPCPQPCKERLPCGHECIGLCGDPCPYLCRVCHKDLLVSENVNTDRFVYLQGCDHVIELNRLTSWIEDCVTQFPNCPECGHIITKHCRFKNYERKSKDKLLEMLNAKSELFDVLLYEFHTFCGVDNVPTYYFLELQKKLDEMLVGRPNPMIFAVLPTVIFCLRELYNWSTTTELMGTAEIRFEILIAWITNNLETVSYQQLQEFKEAVLMLKRS